MVAPRAGAEDVRRGQRRACECYKRQEDQGGGRLRFLNLVPSKVYMYQYVNPSYPLRTHILRFPMLLLNRTPSAREQQPINIKPSIKHHNFVEEVTQEDEGETDLCITCHPSFFAFSFLRYYLAFVLYFDWTYNHTYVLFHTHI